MKKFLYPTLTLIISAAIGYFSLRYLSGYSESAGIFISGVLFGIFLMIFKLNVKNNTVDIYKRELERKSVSSLECDDRIKILESKIKVLEKALDKALGK